MSDLFLHVFIYPIYLFVLFSSLLYIQKLHATQSWLIGQYFNLANKQTWGMKCDVEVTAGISGIAGGK